MSYMDDIHRRRENFRNRANELRKDSEMQTLELERLVNIARNTTEILDDLDKEFEKRTSLNSTDITFLFAATALQCLRIYVINEITRVEKAGFGNKKEKMIHEGQDWLFDKLPDKEAVSYTYYASLYHIINSRGVPYDATSFTDENFGFFKGGNHRFATFGHDPILGLLFGTANILTNTITCKTSTSIAIPTTYHVTYDAGGQNPKISQVASTIEMFDSAAERIADDKTSVVAALIKQILHIGTDLYTPCGIQIPAANLVLTTQHTELLTRYISIGDIIKIGASYKVFNLINMLISALHMLTCKSRNERDINLHRVKTNKIIAYSNMIATSSNVIYNAVKIYQGNAKAAKDIDLAGIIGTILLLIHSFEFKRKIKEEFIFGNYNKMISDRAY